MVSEDYQEKPHSLILFNTLKAYKPVKFSKKAAETKCLTIGNFLSSAKGFRIIITTIST